MKRIDITKMSINELEEFVQFLRDTHEIIEESQNKWESERSAEKLADLKFEGKPLD